MSLKLKFANYGNLRVCRYTIWVPLYPIGFICEGVIALRNIPYFEETEQFSIQLPNRYLPNHLNMHRLT